MAEAQNFHDLNYTYVQLDLELSPKAILSLVLSEVKDFEVNGACIS